MNARLRTILRVELEFHFRRPLFWILIVLLALVSWGLSAGNVRIQSGDTAIGAGEQAWLTSEFSNALMLPMVTFLFYSFFIAVAAGMAVPRDEELRVGPILHATRLTPAEYVGGKLAAALLAFGAVLAVHLLLAAFFNHIVPNANAENLRGPFSPLAYVRPAVVMALPFVVFLTGASLAIGELTRRPILVFSAPVALFLVSIFFLWDWSPGWLDPRVNRLLQWIEPSGFRWINETWIKVDLGVEHYNRAPVGYDLPFLASRALLALAGLGLAAYSARHFARTLRGDAAPRPRRRLFGRRSAPAPTPVRRARSRLAALDMTARPPGFLRTALDVARFEALNLASQPGLYLFVPLILVQTVGSLALQVGAFDTPLLVTSGTAAVASMNTLTLLVCLLLLFYSAESVTRERNVGLHPVYWSTPARTGAVLLGKAVANGVVAAVILLAAWLGAVGVMLFQGKVAPVPGPFLLVWGGLLLPTFLVWAGFVTAVVALTNSRATTYAVGLAALLFSGWKQFRGETSWVGSWNLWSTATWTDFGGLAPNETAFLLNRLFWLAVLAFLIVLTVRFFPRRERDSGATLDRLRPRALTTAALKLLPWAVPAIALGATLHARVEDGFQGGAAERREKEYWGRNLQTWLDAETPRIAAADVDVEIDPQRRSFATRGTWRLTNAGEAPLRRFPMSVGDHFEGIAWTLDGRDFETDDRARLHVFDLPRPLAPGDTIDVGFSVEGRLPHGFTKNGGGMGQFILPEGVVLTSFTPSFLPVPGFDPGRGVDEDNQTDPKDWEDGFWEGITPPAFGAGARYPVRTRITGPAAWDWHGVGVKVEDAVTDGQRTVVWETDHPVNFFNVVGGRWATWEGEGVSIHHHPDHLYNLEEMGEALEAARRWYSEWFWPYPWKELKLSEFPGIADYAQGHPTNITFSESIGFLTRSRADANAAFMVTAHEAAHQWWGNLLMPGEGPGGNVLSEGMAHFSTMLLFEQVKGERERIGFARRIEESYGEDRQVDSERPLARTDGSKGGDQTVTYDKGGWVFWMLHDLMGKEASLAGFSDFIGQAQSSDDYPVLQDFVAVMREHAPDRAAFDAFVEQWIFDVVVPEYRFSDLSKERKGERWVVRATIENAGTGRMPVEVAAVAGERWPEDPAAEANWREVRATVTLGAGESAEVTLESAFEPERLLADPDARVLMLKRERAEADL